MKHIRTFLAALTICIATAASAAIPAGLPANAQLSAKSPYYEIYIQSIQEADEEDQASVVAIWVKDLRNKTVKKLFTTNPLTEPRWADMKDGNAVSVPLNSIASAEKVFFVPYDVHTIIVQGCPDLRNVWSYIINLEKQTAKQLCSTSGLVGFSNEACYIIMESYRYNTDPEVGGRFPVLKVFDQQGKFIKELELPSGE